MIADLAVTNAKIIALDAGKITTGTLSAARIAAGSITSDRLTIANGFIRTAMIADLAVTNAKIAALDAAKINTGTLNAGRIGAGSITANHLAANAIQVGLGGWNNSIRITPTAIDWITNNTVEGRLSANGLHIQEGATIIGWQGRSVGPTNNLHRRRIHYSLDGGGHGFVWSFRTATSGATTGIMDMDPRGLMRSPARPGIHFWQSIFLHQGLRTLGDNRQVFFADQNLGTPGVFAGFSSPNSQSRVCFGNDLFFVSSNGNVANWRIVVARLNDIMNRLNGIIVRLNHGWITANGSTWGNSGQTEMSRNLT